MQRQPDHPRRALGFANPPHDGSALIGRTHGGSTRSTPHRHHNTDKTRPHLPPGSRPHTKTRWRFTRSRRATSALGTLANQAFRKRSRSVRVHSTRSRSRLRQRHALPTDGPRVSRGGQNPRGSRNSEHGATPPRLVAPVMMRAAHSAWPRAPTRTRRSQADVASAGAVTASPRQPAVHHTATGLGLGYPRSRPSIVTSRRPRVIAVA